MFSLSIGKQLVILIQDALARLDRVDNPDLVASQERLESKFCLSTALNVIL